MKKKIIYTLLFLSSAMFCHAQNAANDLKKMNQYYLDNSHVALDIEYRFYANHTSQKAIDVQQAEYKKSGNKFYYHTNGITTVQNSKYKLAVHESNEIIMVEKKGKKIDPSLFTGVFMDSVLTLCKKIDFVTTASGKKRYTLTYKSSKYVRFKKLVVELTNNNTLSKMVYYYNNPINYTPEEDDIEEAPRMEIIYKNTSTKSIAASQYSIAKFVKVTGEQVSPMKKYTGYRIINHLM